ncbi:MAG: RusA family crossover junction endodeoxyribonuclease [Erysipelotrichaceae bacterium]|nr:RusA family crossover junction endodeoxyribonuclease [Erysipelotrichaceae bacterium]
MITFVSKEKPLSYNSKHKADYQVRLRQQFACYQSDYPQIPVSDELSVKLIYIHKDHQDIPDIDNISKPFIDAFSKVIYHDDSQVRHRECTRIPIEEYENQAVEINLGNMSVRAAEDLISYLDDKDVRHIVFCEIRRFDLNQVRIG